MFAHGLTPCNETCTLYHYQHLHHCMPLPLTITTICMCTSMLQHVYTYNHLAPHNCHHYIHIYVQPPCMHIQPPCVYSLVYTLVNALVFQRKTLPAQVATTTYHHHPRAHSTRRNRTTTIASRVYLHVV